MDKTITKKEGIIVALILTAMLMTSTLTIAQTATPTAMVIDYSQTQIPTDLKPGDKKPIYIVVQNTGGLPARDVHVTLPTVGGITTEGPSGDSITSGGDWFLGTINSNGQAQLISSIRIRDTATIGTHYLTLYITYDESRYTSSGALEQEEKTTKWILPVEVTSGSLLEIKDFKINPEAVNAGENIQLALTLTNTGDGDAMDVKAFLGMPKDGNPTNTQINLALANAFTVLGASDKKIGNINKNLDGIVNMIIHVDEDIKSKAYTLPLTAEYEDKSGTVHTDIFYLGVFVSGEGKLTITNFESDPVELHSDTEDVEFTGNIENQGTEQVKNVKVTFNPEYPLKNARSYVQAKDVGSIKAGGSTEFTFYADVDEDADPQKTNIAFDITYEINGNPVQEQIVYTLDILDHPRFKLDSTATPTRPTDKGLATALITNEGSKCDGVTLIILEKRDQPFGFDDKSAYIGDLDNLDTGEASISFTVEEKATPQQHIIPVEIRCTKDDDVLVFDKTLKLNVAPAPPEASKLMQTLLTIVFLVAIAVFAYRHGHNKGNAKACEPENNIKKK